MKVPPGHPMALSAACLGSLISSTAMHVALPLVVTLVTLGEPHPHHWKAQRTPPDSGDGCEDQRLARQQRFDEIPSHTKHREEVRVWILNPWRTVLKTRWSILQLPGLQAHPKLLQLYIEGFPSGSAVKNPPASAADVGSIPGLARSPGEQNGNPLQYYCLENSMDRGAWWAAVHGVTKSQSQLSD